MRTVLHVLPHPGGGGETYVGALEAMDGYRFERAYLAPSPLPADALRSLPRTIWSAFRSADVLHVHGEVAGGICLPALGARRSVVTLHGLHLLRRANGFKRLTATANLRAILHAATLTICVSQAEEDEVLRLSKATAQRLVVIHNGVDPHDHPASSERAAARAELGLPGEAVVCLYLGSLDSHKDPGSAVRAAIEVARSEPLVLLVAGDGPLRPELERIAHGSAAVRLLGHRTSLRPLFAASDVFVLPSWREGLSFSLLEAMAAGLIPVVSDAPGNPEVIGTVGFVVRRGDISGFGAALRELAQDEAMRRDNSERARQRVAAAFRRDEMVARTEELYDRLVGGRRVG
jgi:glycosyltransferase involved in cell wall biosynthesis